jgi:hypothetical protein
MHSAETTPKAEHSPTPPVGRPSRTKLYLLVTALALAALSSCYLAGWWMGRSEVKKLQAQGESDRATAKLTLSQCAEQSTHYQRAARMLEARRNLDQAVAALDARNFGIAELLLKRTSHWLAAGSAEGPGAELAKTLESYRFVASEDVGAQRKQLIDWIGQLDPLIVLPDP